MNSKSSWILALIIFFRSNRTQANEPDTTHINWLRLAGTSTLVVGVSAYAVNHELETWGRTRGKFHFKDDWNGDYLAQSDEASHLLYAYKMTQLAYMLARFCGFSKRVSLYAGSSIAFLWMFSVEYPIDAYNPKQGFGFSDLAFNIAGVASAFFREKYPKLKSFDFKLTFKDNPFKRKSIIAQSINEYDNVIYWLTYTPHKKEIPLNLGLGYSTYRTSWKNPHREFYFTIGTSFSDLWNFISKPKMLTDFLGLWEFPLTRHIEKK